MQPRLLAVLALLALAGCASPADQSVDGAEDANVGESAKGPRADDGSGPAGQTPAQPSTLTYAEDVRLALGDCTDVGTTNACLINVGDPRVSGDDSGNLVHVPFTGVQGAVSTGSVTFTWTSQSPLNDRLELRLALLSCDADGCGTKEVLVAQEGTSPHTIDLAALDLPGDVTLGASVTRAQAATGVRASTFQDIHVDASVTFAG